MSVLDDLFSMKPEKDLSKLEKELLQESKSFSLLTYPTKLAVKNSLYKKSEYFFDLQKHLLHILNYLHYIRHELIFFPYYKGKEGNNVFNLEAYFSNLASDFALEMDVETKKDLLNKFGDVKFCQEYRNFLFYLSGIVAEAEFATLLYFSEIQISSGKPKIFHFGDRSEKYIIKKSKNPDPNFDLRVYFEPPKGHGFNLFFMVEHNELSFDRYKHYRYFDIDFKDTSVDSIKKYGPLGYLVKMIYFFSGKGVYEIPKLFQVYIVPSEADIKYEFYPYDGYPNYRGKVVNPEKYLVLQASYEKV